MCLLPNSYLVDDVFINLWVMSARGVLFADSDEEMEDVLRGDPMFSLSESSKSMKFGDFDMNSN